MKTKNKIIICIIIFAILIGIVIFSIFNNNSEYMSFKDFYSEFENGKISDVFIKDDKLEFKIIDDNKTYYTENPNYDDFEKELLLNNVSIETSSTEDTLNIVFNLLLFAIIICFIILFAYKYYETNNKIFKIVKHTNVKFDDIAGMSNIKKDMKQIIDTSISTLLCTFRKAAKRKEILLIQDRENRTMKRICKYILRIANVIKELTRTNVWCLISKPLIRRNIVI